MRIFCGYGYNERDAWIKKDVFPILRALGIDIVHGQELYGENLDAGVAERIEQADAMVGFCTLREGQENSELNTHKWVALEMAYALALRKPLLEIREEGVRDIGALLGQRQRIDLRGDDRLAAISELVQAIAGWSMRQLMLVPVNRSDATAIIRAMRNRELTVRYRTRVNGIDSKFREGRLEKIDGSLRLNVLGVVDKTLIYIEFITNRDGTIDTGFVSADPIRIEFGDREE